MKIILNFKDVKNKKDILEVFQDAFMFAFPPRGYDSLEDSLMSLDTESKVYIDHKKGKKSTLEVVVTHLEIVKKILPNDFKIISEIVRKIDKKV